MASTEEQGGLTAQEIEDLVLYRKHGDHIAVIELNRPHRANAMVAPHSFLELGRKLERAEDDDSIKAIVLTGAGANFCSGVDLARVPLEAAGLTKGAKLPQSARLRTGANRGADPLHCDKTIIAAVNGTCVAAGFHYVVAADLVIAAEDARMGEPAARIGFAGFSPILPVLALKIGVNRARSLLLTGRLASAAELHDWGLVESVVPQEQLLDEALRYAEMVAWHSTDNLMLSRRSMRLFWDLVGVSSYRNWSSVGYAVSTNVVWRPDEFNFMKERAGRGAREAMDELNRQWSDMGW
jgi:enoyl-CoA hydratase